MNNLKHYKFINSDTGSVIYYLSLPADSANIEAELEAARLKIAADNGLYIGNVYYVADTEDERDSGIV